MWAVSVYSRKAQRKKLTVFIKANVKVAFLKKKNRNDI